MKHFSAFFLAVLLVCAGQPASAVTYKTVLDFRYHGNLTFKISQAGKLVDEVYDSLQWGTSLKHLLVNEPIDIELTTHGPSRFLGASYRENLPSTKVCNLKVGLGEASGRYDEEDPSRWLGEIPMEITWEEKKLDFFNLFYWQASASGRVTGLSTSDMGMHNELKFHVVCDGQVLDTFEHYFYHGLKSRPVVPEPKVTLKNNVVTVNLGNLITYQLFSPVNLTFFQCKKVADECSVYGTTQKYYSNQIKGPLEFTTQGISEPFFDVLVEVENDYGVTSMVSNTIEVAGTISKTYSLPKFSGSSTKLSNSQKAKIKSELGKLAGLTEVKCVSYIVTGQSVSERAKAQARAKEACLYVKSVVKGVATEAVTQMSQSKANSNKVVLQISN